MKILTDFLAETNDGEYRIERKGLNANPQPGDTYVVLEKTDNAFIQVFACRANSSTDAFNQYCTEI